MRIPKPKGLKTRDIALAVVFGVVSGVYIYKPFFVGPNKLKEEEKKGENFELFVSTSFVG